MYQERVERFVMKMLQPIRNVLQVTWRKRYNVSGMSSVLQVAWRICYNVSGGSSKSTWQRYYYVSKRRTWRNGYDVSRTSCKLPDENVTTYQELVTKKNYYVSKRPIPKETVTTYQERLASSLKKTQQRIKNALQAAWRRCCNVSGTSCKSLKEIVTMWQERVQVTWKNVTTFQERFAIYLTKMLQRINTPLRLASDLKNMLQLSKRILKRHVPTIFYVSKTRTWKKCFNISGTFVSILKEDATTYQGRLANYLTKMLKRIKNVLQDTRRICYNVSGGSSKDTWQKYSYVSKTRAWRICYNVLGTSRK